MLGFVAGGLALQFNIKVDLGGIGNGQQFEFAAVFLEDLIEFALQEEASAEVKKGQQSGHEDNQHTGIPEGELKAERACQSNE